MLSGAYVEEGYKEFDRNFFSPCMTACNWEFRHVECSGYLLSEKFPSGLTVRIYRISLKQLIGVCLSHGCCTSCSFSVSLFALVSRKLTIEYFVGLK